MKSPEDLFNELAETAYELGWVMAINEEGNGDISGIVVGTRKYIDNILMDLHDAEDYAICQYAIPVDPEEMH